MRFTCIDFETANSNYESVCAVGIATFEKGDPIEAKSWLVKPHKDYFYFESINVMIHGITEGDVRKSLEFSEIYKRILPFFRNSIVVAHNASFDMSVLRHVLTLYEIPFPRIDYLCTYKVIVESYDSPEFYPAEKYPELSPPDKCTKERLSKSYKILSEHISPDTPMAIIINTYDQTSYHHVGDNMLGSDDRKEKVILTEFRNFVKYSGEYRYLTTIIIGDNTTVVFDKYMYTPQWNYHWTYCPIMLEKVSNLPYLTSLKDFRKNEQT